MAKQASSITLLSCSPSPQTLLDPSISHINMGIRNRFLPAGTALASSLKTIQTSSRCTIVGYSHCTFRTHSGHAHI